MNSEYEFDFDGGMVFAEFVKEFGDRFVGLDGRVYGPFEQGDVIRLPEEQKQILEENGYVE